MNRELKSADDFLDKIKLDDGTKKPDEGTEKPIEADKAAETEVKNVETEVVKPTDAWDFTKLSEEVGFEVKGFEDIKSRVSKATELETSLQTLTEELTGYKQFAEEAVDPLSYMSPEGLHVENVKKKYPNLERSVAEKLLKADVKEMKDIDALILSEALKHSGILREDEAEAKVLEDLKIEDVSEIADMSDLKKKLMLVKVREAKELIAREQEASRVLPERRTPQDFIAKHNEAKVELGKKIVEAYNPIVDNIISNLKEVIKDGEDELITIVPTEDDAKSLKEFALGQVSHFLLDTSEASQKEVEYNIRAKYLHDNYKALFKAIKTTNDTKWQKHIDEKFANHKEVGLQREATQGNVTPTAGFEDMVKGLPNPGWK